MLANGQNSFNCSEESCTNPFADTYLSSPNIYNLCSEEVVNMKYVKGFIPWNKGKEGLQAGENHPLWGKHHSEETRRKISESNKGKRSWNKGRKGLQEAWNKGKKGVQTAWNKGLPFSEETKQRMSAVKKGKHLSPKTEFKEGQESWNKGKPVSEETRKRLTEYSRGRVGEKAANWQGGISFLPYCHRFNKQLKEKIRERDNRTCQLCGEKENGRRLDVHHIHYDKSNCDPDLIALCKICNLKVNGNRDYYEELFMNKLIDRGITAAFFAEKLLERTPITNS